MADKKKTDAKAPESEEPKTAPEVTPKAEAPKPTEKPKKEDESNDYPNFPGDAEQDYLDINDPKHGNLTYEELQRRSSKK